MKLTARERLTGESKRVDDLLRVTADSGWTEFLYRLGELTGGVKYEKVKDVPGAIASNPVASRTVDMVAESISLLPVNLYRDKELIEEPGQYKDLMRIFTIPNPDDISFTWRQFMKLL